jgi:hypothetical protein
VLKRLISAAVKVEDVMHNTKHSLSDIIILNVHAPAEGKIDDVKNSFYEELQHVFDELPKHNL